jgi:Ca2+-binding RTX toxin-like protein
LFTSNTDQALIDLTSGTSDYNNLKVSIVQVWNDPDAKDAIYRVYVANETDSAVSLANNTNIVGYTILGDDPATSKVGDPNNGLIDLINADPLIGNFNNFNNIENALTKDAVDGFQTNPSSPLTAGADKVWSSPNETGTGTGETPPTSYYNTLGGNDALYGMNNTGTETLLGGDSNDLIDGRDGIDVMEGGAGDDQLFGSLGDDILYGGTGDDILFGSYGSDSLTGGDGKDIFIVRLGDYDKIMDFNADEDQIRVWVDTLTLTGGTTLTGYTTSYTGGVLFVDGSPVVELIGSPLLGVDGVFFT